MIIKNKTKDFAIKIVDMTGKDGDGVMIRFIPCVDVWFNDGVIFGMSWICWGFELWFTDVTDLT